MATLTVSKEDEKRVKALGFLSNKGTDNFSGRIITKTERSLRSSRSPSEKRQKNSEMEM